MTTFREQIAAGARAIRAQVGVAITYARGDASVSITKAVKFPIKRRASFADTAIDVTLQDWGIDIVDLVLSGSATKPQRGDRITFTETGDVFEALPDEGENIWHPTAADTQYRIHSKKIVAGDA